MIYLDYPTELPENVCALTTGLLDGSPAWTNAHVLFIGPCPSSDDITEMPQEKFQKGIDRGDPGNMPEIFPVVCKWHMGRYCIFFWGSQVVINELYFRMTLERFPDAKFFSDGIHQIRVESAGARVGILCRVDPKGIEFPDEVRAYQSANAVPAQPANESPAERQQQKETLK